MRQQDVIEYLRTHPPAGPAALAAHFEVTPRAMQSILRRMRAAGVVDARGAQNDRVYFLVEPLPPEPAPPLPPPAASTTPGGEGHLATLRRISAQLTQAGIPTTKEGRTLPIEVRLMQALAEREAADTSIDDDIRKRAMVALDTLAVRSVVRALLGRDPSPDDVLKTVVEAGLAALSGERPPPR